MPRRGLFVTGTDTGAGKSVLSASLAAAMRAAGETVRAHKPVLTGLDEPPGDWPRDHELLAAAAGMEPDAVAPLRFGPAVSPHLAAELEGRQIDPRELLASARREETCDGPRDASDGPRDASDGPPGASPARPGGRSPILIVEGVGGLLVPLAEGWLVRDLAVALGLPLLVAARPGLGTINHTLLTLEAARAASLTVAAVVMTPWPAEPDAMLRSNRATVERLGETPVHLLPLTAPDTPELARAAQGLPWREWIGS
ncbi:MAG: ATP-dependent dethiobiotin synthetase BioD [Solirubrobacteraceae bacterium]